MNLKNRIWQISQQVLLPTEANGNAGLCLDHEGQKEFYNSVLAAAESGEDVYIYGPSGTGKSTFIELLSRCYPQNEAPVILSVPKLQSDILANKNPDFHLSHFIQTHAHRWIVLDDMGAEQDWRSFGHVLNFAYDLLERRRKGKSATWIVSNSTRTELAEKYEVGQGRIFERLKPYAPIQVRHGSLTKKRRLKPYPWPKWKEPEQEQEPGVPCPPHLKQEIEAKLRRIGVDTEADIDKPGLGSQLKMQLFKHQNNEQ